MNYKDPNYQDQIEKFLGNEFIDTYFDNVGGDILSFVLTKVKKFGNVVACGSIAGYNNREALKVSNWGEITVNSLTVRGFIVTDYQEHFPKAIGILTDAVKAGKIVLTVLIMLRIYTDMTLSIDWKIYQKYGTNF